MTTDEKLKILKDLIPHIRNLDNRLPALLDQVANLRLALTLLQRAHRPQGTGITGPLSGLSDSLEALEGGMKKLEEDVRGAGTVTAVLRVICDEADGS